MTNIGFGTGICRGVFPNATNDTHTRIWVITDPISTADRPIKIEVEAQPKITPDSTGLDKYKMVKAFLTRDEARELKDALERLLEEVGLEVVPEPECDYLKDQYGWFWVKSEHGDWYSGSTLKNAQARAAAPLNPGALFANLLSAYGRLHAYVIPPSPSHVEVGVIEATP